jgi:hypothetical protein
MSEFYAAIEACAESLEDAAFENRPSAVKNNLGDDEDNHGREQGPDADSLPDALRTLPHPFLTVSTSAIRGLFLSEMSSLNGINNSEMSSLNGINKLTAVR